MKKIRTNIIRMGIYISKCFLNIIYFCLKIFPTKYKIVMLSRQSNKPSIDFNFIEKEIIKQDKNVKIKVLCKVLKKNVKDRILYCFYILKCMYHIATARVCILDGYSIPISILKHKKDLKIIQIWHASGAIKKFGYQSINKKEGRGEEISKLMNMHKNYSVVMAPSITTAEFYKEAFGVDDGKIFINGLPRLDYILDENAGIDKINEIYEQYDKLRDKNKKIILYVPTFRKCSDNAQYIKELIESINYDKYNLIIRLHPLDNNNELVKDYSISKKYSTYDLLKISDYIITDYSAVAFEASILDKPIFFYVYDINEYEKIRGLNVNLFEEMKNATSINIKEIVECIENNKYDYNELNEFKNRYIEDISIYNTKKLVNLILKYLNKGAYNEKIKDTVNEHSKEKLNI